VFGLEMHLVTLHKAVEDFQPTAVILDPVSSLIAAGTANDVKSMLVRLFDYLKLKQITCIATSLAAGAEIEQSTTAISSLIDTWIQVRDIEIAGERTRGLYLVKSRGMGHSNQVREFVISSRGVDLVPVAIGPSGVLTGSARLQHHTEQEADANLHRLELERRRRQIERKRKALAAQIEAMQAELAAEEEDSAMLSESRTERDQRVASFREQLSARRSTAAGRQGPSW
jgi:circadian clock protein KaiC